MDGTGAGTADRVRHLGESAPRGRLGQHPSSASQTRITLSLGHALHLHLPWSSPNTTTLLFMGNSCMRSSIGPSLALLQGYQSMR